MTVGIFVAFDHPANAGVLRYLEERAHETDAPASESPDSIPAVYLRLGTHPDLVEWLWVTMAGDLPVNCRWVVYRRPVLVHPHSGVLFGLAGGTHMYAWRLPEPERTEAVQAGAARRFVVNGNLWLDLERFGPEWVFGLWRRDEVRWCRAAYDFAGALDRSL
jgi:hypothetical protein